MFLATTAILCENDYLEHYDASQLSEGISALKIFHEPRDISLKTWTYNDNYYQISGHRF